LRTPSFNKTNKKHQKKVGPELEIPGYGCEDHFLELDTVQHSWEVLAALLAGGHTGGLLCDFGMPVIHRGRVLLYAKGG
jgi:predicted amidohydrolase